MMRKFSATLISFLLLLQSSLWAYSSNPKDFVNELVNDAINTLSDKNLNKDQKSAFIEKIALENVDINALGLYTLGELRKSSKKMIFQNFKNLLKSIFKKSHLEINRLFNQ